MANLVALKIAMVVFACMLVSAPYAESAITCGQIAGNLVNCLAYLKSGKGAPAAPCCNGVKSLNAAAKSTADRQAACTCLKTLARSSNANGINANAAAGLPGKCGVNIGYPINFNTDCTK
ncbi:hypothetical protein ACHQM5_004813 [Ranunculus cassubicifolius]